MAAIAETPKAIVISDDSERRLFVTLRTNDVIAKMPDGPVALTASVVERLANWLAQRVEDID